MPPSERSSLSRSRVQVQHFLLGEADAAARDDLIEFAQARDRLRHGLPVGQRAAEPALIDVVLRAALSRGFDVIGGLALGADEQHAAAAGGDFAHLQQRLVQQRHRLRQVEDVDVGLSRRR